MGNWPAWLKSAIVAVVIFFFLPLSWIVVATGNRPLVFIYSIVIAVILAAFAAVILAKIITNEIDLKYLISEDNGNASLSRFQFLLFTFVIAASYFLLLTAVVTSVGSAANPDVTLLKLPEIPGSVLGLIGISGGSYVVAKAIQKGADVGSSVVRVDITNPGAGYAAAPTVAFVGGGGTGAQATATIVNASVSAITLTTHGSGYTTPPTVQVTAAAGDHGAGATAVAVIG